MKDDRPEESGEKKQMRLQTVYIWLLVIAAIFAGFLVWNVVRTAQSYQDLKEASDAYIASRQNGEMMQKASDDLTEMVRSFAVTGEKRYVDAYFEEVEVTRRRDAAVAGINDYLADSAVAEALNDAMRWSSELETIEYYAMRLTVAANGEDAALYPQKVQDVRLTDADLALDADAQRQKAVQLVFDETYRDYKEKIHASVARCFDALIESTREKQAESDRRVRALLAEQDVLIGIVIFIVLFIALITSWLIIHPLKSTIDHIRSKEHIEPKGAYELQFLARTYNQMFDASLAREEALLHEAAHDPLTGLYNRSIFEQYRASDSTENYAFLELDIDFFKKINDTYGHDIGDQVLKRVAKVLLSNFRSEDDVCRIGGEEFSVIMHHIGSGLRELIARKAQTINRQLLTPEDDLPTCSLSIGIAFGAPDLSMDQLYKNADTALYYVKHHGRNGWAFFDELEK